MKLKPIGIETQIEDTLLGMNSNTKEDITLKVNFTKSHLDDIISINGKRVYYPMVEGENIWYYLQKAPKGWKVSENPKDRSHYYPIQYAEIVIF